MIPSENTNRAASRKARHQSIVIVDSRALERECFVKAIATIQPKVSVEAFSNVGECLAKSSAMELDSVLYNVEGRRLQDARVKEDIAALVGADHSTPVIILSPYEELSEMIAALDAGASGYIPASLGIEATIVAIRLASASAIFVPAKMVLSLRDRASTSSIPNVKDYFTPRQASVADALRRGKSNKVIAYELNMCESTVKVHIRNIMKKLGVRNRTEASYKLHSLLEGAKAGDP